MYRAQPISEEMILGRQNPNTIFLPNASFAPNTTQPLVAASSGNRVCTTAVFVYLMPARLGLNFSMTIVRGANAHKTHTANIGDRMV